MHCPSNRASPWEHVKEMTIEGGIGKRIHLGRPAVFDEGIDHCRCYHFQKWCEGGQAVAFPFSKMSTAGINLISVGLGDWVLRVNSLPL